MLSTSALSGWASHPTDPLSMTQCSCSSLHYSVLWIVSNQDLVGYRGKCQRAKKATHTGQVRVCSVQKALEWFQVIPSLIGPPGLRRVRKSWLRGFCRAARFLQDTGWSGSLGSSLAWDTEKVREVSREKNKDLLTARKTKTYLLVRNIKPVRKCQNLTAVIKFGSRHCDPTK